MPNVQSLKYHYDPEHRLIEASHYGRAPAAGDQATPLSQARYGYDGLGRRVWKQVEHQGQPPELTVFSWDGDLLQSEERFQGRLPVLRYTAPPLALALEKPERKLSTPVAQRVHSLDTAAMVPQRRVSYLFEPESFIPAAKLEVDYEAIPQATGTGTVLYSDYRLSEPKLYYFQTDHLGTPLEVTDSHGRLAWVGHYRAWGKLDKARDGNGKPAVTDNPFRFRGQYHDEETGLHYNRHRYYDPEIGRFTTQDPIGLAGGENLYQYAPNPTGWVDPLGLSKAGNCNCDSENAPSRGYHNESYGNNPVKPEDATDRWDEFLGPGPHTNTHPRTGQADPDRIVSADGARSIRYGQHEMNSSPTKHHYHEEIWTLDTESNVMNVDNTVVRVPLPKK